MKINGKSNPELQKILIEFNNNYCEFPKNKTIHELFSEQAKKTPESTALIFEKDSITYRELDLKSNIIADILTKKGVSPDTIVGIMVERSFDMIIGMLGILKSSGCYMPIDPYYPKDRINYMLKDSNTKLLITQSNLDNDVDNNIEKIYIDKIEYNKPINDINLQKTVSGINSSSLAYVIYTSGSTGNPKGVMIEHKSVVNFIEGISKIINFGKNKTILCSTTMSFDIFVLESWLALAKGFKVVIASSEQQINPDMLCDLILNQKIDTIQVTPSRMKMILLSKKAKACLSNLNTILIGGELLSESLLKEIKPLTSAKIYNMYGPTETTVWSTVKEIDNYKKITIGKPISNTFLYVVDENINPVGIGVQGELCIGGEGLARGYLNNENLTNEKFIINPFRKNEKIYKTGDLVRWLSNGEIEYIGRIDNQVKIKGYRIEPGEIEHNLRKHPQINDAIVIPRQYSPDEVHLHAFYTSDIHISENSLRRHLSSFLPDYMIPSKFIHIEQFPLTPNGKVDKLALQRLNISTEATKINKVKNPNDIIKNPVFLNTKEYHKIISTIISNVLKLDSENIEFSESLIHLGCDSISAYKISNQINKTLGIYISALDILHSPSVHNIIKQIETLSIKEERISKSTHNKQYYPVTNIQKTFYISNILFKDSLINNIPTLIQIKGNINLQKLESSINTIIERHDVLRTYFSVIKNKIVQYILPEIKIKLEPIYIKASDVDKITNDLLKPFDLENPPLFRLYLLKVSDTFHYLLFDIHHIIFDGESLNIFMNELVNLYSSNHLPKINLQYTDYSVWYNSQLKSPAVKEQKKYWKNKSKQKLPLIFFPIDKKGSALYENNGKNTNFILDKKTVDKLRTIAFEENTTLNNVLFSIFSLLIYKFVEENKFIIFSFSTARNTPQLENLIGLVGYSLPLFFNVNPNDKFTEHLNKTTLSFKEAIKNQEFPSENYLFSKIFVKYILNLFRGYIKFLSFFLFIYRNELKYFDFVTEDEITFTINEIFPPAISNLLIITHAFHDKEDNLLFNIQYNASLFNEATIEMIIEHWKKLISIIESDKNIIISKINIFDSDTYNKIQQMKSITKSGFLTNNFLENIRMIAKNLKATFDVIKLK